VCGVELGIFASCTCPLETPAGCAPRPGRAGQRGKVRRGHRRSRGKRIETRSPRPRHGAGPTRCSRTRPMPGATALGPPRSAMARKAPRSRGSADKNGRSSGDVRVRAGAEERSGRAPAQREEKAQLHMRVAACAMGDRGQWLVWWVPALRRRSLPPPGGGRWRTEPATGPAQSSSPGSADPRRRLRPSGSKQSTNRVVSPPDTTHSRHPAVVVRQARAAGSTTPRGRPAEAVLPRHPVRGSSASGRAQHSLADRNGPWKGARVTVTDPAPAGVGGSRTCEGG